MQINVKKIVLIIFFLFYIVGDLVTTITGISVFQLQEENIYIQAFHLMILAKVMVLSLLIILFIASQKNDLLKIPYYSGSLFGSILGFAATFGNLTIMSRLI